MKKLVLITGVVGIILTAHAQHRIGDFMAYGSTDGLPASFYYSVLQSSDGYLWIGSSSGLVRFDGKNYQVYFSDYADTNSISDNVVNDLIEDDNHNLWIAGLYQGLTKLNLRTGAIKRYTHLSPKSIPAYGIGQLFKDDAGEIWIATSGHGLAHYLSATDSLEFFMPDPLRPLDGSDPIANYITGIAADKSDENVLWLSGHNGLYSFDKRERKFQRFVFSHPDDKNAALPFLAIETDHGDQIWLGTWYYGMMSFDKHTQQFKTYPYPEADPDNSLHYVVLDIKQINDSTLYIASGNMGLLSFNTRSAKIQALLTSDQLPDGSSSIDIQRISITPDAGIFVGGNYYIYHQHPSFNRFARSVSFPYGTHFGVEKIIHDQYRKGYWVACLNAFEMIFLQQEMRSRTLYMDENKPNDQFLDLAIDRKKRVWVVTSATGLRVFNEDDGMFGAVDDTHAGIDSLAQGINGIESDEDGNLWLLGN